MSERYLQVRAHKSNQAGSRNTDREEMFSPPAVQAEQGGSAIHPTTKFSFLFALNATVKVGRPQTLMNILDTEVVLVISPTEQKHAQQHLHSNSFHTKADIIWIQPWIHPQADSERFYPVLHEPVAEGCHSWNDKITKLLHQMFNDFNPASSSNG